MHGIVKGWLDPKDREVKQLVRLILEWLIWSCVKGINEDTSATETDPQSNSDHNNESRDHIIKKSTVLPKRICEIGYNSFTIMHFLEKNSQEKDRYNKNSLGAIGKREY